MALNLLDVIATLVALLFGLCALTVWMHDEMSQRWKVPFLCCGLATAVLIAAVWL
jgi:intracellular septation protein A